jgi:hypothetical protein
MKLYRIKRKHIRYDQLMEVIVWAQNEDAARIHTANKFHPGKHPATCPGTNSCRDEWLDPKRSTCTEIQLPDRKRLVVAEIWSGS